MEQSNKSKGWLYRLKHFKLRKRSSSGSRDDQNPEIFERQLSSNLQSNEGTPRSVNSFRRSLRKMQTRMKNCVLRQNRTARNHTIHVSNISSSSSQSSRVTLRTPPIHLENIYSLEPNSRCIPNSSHIEDSVTDRVLHAGSAYQDVRLDQEDRRHTPENVGPEIPRRNFPQLQQITNCNIPKNEIQSLAHCAWYWGPISRSQAEEKLLGEPDGSFLIRDSASYRYIFAMSFRSVGQTLHSRIEYTRGGYSLFDHAGYKTIKELINDALDISKTDIYCYTMNRDDILPNFPVRLIKPISRFNEVRTLKHLTRFVIRQFINKNDIERLPLPQTVVKYLQEDNIFF